jgi:hypothetical protein
LGEKFTGLKELKHLHINNSLFVLHFKKTQHTIARVWRRRLRIGNEYGRKGKGAKEIEEWENRSEEASLM